MLIRLLRTYLRPYGGNLTMVVVLQLIGTIASLYLPSLNADIIDNGVAKGDIGYIMDSGGWMLTVSLIQIVCTIAAVYFGAKTAMSFGRDLRGGIFHRVGTFSAREVNRFGAPSLITRTTNDVQQILMVVAVPVLIVAIGLIIRKMVPGFRAMQVAIDGVNRVLREQITGIRVVRAFVREPYETDRFGAANQDLTRIALRVGRLMIRMFPVVMLIFNASSVAVLWFGAHRVDNGEMQVGALTAFLAYLMQILMSVMMATFMAMMIPRAAVSADRIGEVLDTESSVRPPASPISTLTGPGELEFDGVSFQYPGAADAVLKDLAFRAVPGRTTAVIGSTGAGKTTLLSLVPRLFDATGGTVGVDGTDIRDLDPDVLRRRIGLVPQKPYLFSGTVASNLRYGNPDATDEELWEALEIAQAAGFVRAMPEGLDSAIAQGGTNVSGGQRQRLWIARALVAKPQIYLFDDSFSALDLSTDARLRAALRPHTREAAVIIVAQRVSTITDADQILVLEDGRLVGAGRHDELVATCPTYAEIVQSQLAAEEAA